MTRRMPGLAHTLDRGSVSVEAAVCITFVLLPMLAFVLLFGRYFWYYTVAQKAAHDAAVYMASSSLTEIKGRGAAGLASDIIGWETGDFDADTSASVELTAICGYKLSPTSSYISWFNCSGTLTPTQVRAGLIMTVTDPFLSPITNAIVGSGGIPVVAGVTMSYVGH